MAMGTEERLAREIEDRFDRLKSNGVLPEGVVLRVIQEVSTDPDFYWQVFAADARTGARISQIAPIPYELKNPELVLEA